MDRRHAFALLIATAVGCSATSTEYVEVKRPAAQPSTCPPCLVQAAPSCPPIESATTDQASIEEPDEPLPPSEPEGPRPKGATTRDVSIVEYNSYNPYPNHGNTLDDVLRKRGVTLQRLDRLEFVGDESSGTTGLVYVERDRETLDWIWSMMITTAEPYKFWLSSGNRTVRLYVRGKKAPAATLSVNETDSTSVDGWRTSYMCHGLHGLAIGNLKKAAQSQVAAPPNN